MAGHCGPARLQTYSTAHTHPNSRVAPSGPRKFKRFFQTEDDDDASSVREVQKSLRPNFCRRTAGSPGPPLVPARTCTDHPRPGAQSSSSTRPASSPVLFPREAGARVPFHGGCVRPCRPGPSCRYRAAGQHLAAVRVAVSGRLRCIDRPGHGFGLSV